MSKPKPKPRSARGPARDYVAYGIAIVLTAFFAWWWS